jgi:dephospho-CoA kinase
MRPFVVGLTGGIGSGKSSAAAHFERLGAFVIDADALSHQLTQPGGAAIAAISDAFPGVVTAGVLDRAALRERVFADTGERRRLEAILHPMIRQATAAAMSSVAASQAPYVIHMVPLLFESADYASRIDCAVVVDVDAERQVQRVTSTRGVPEATVRQIMTSQMSRGERLRHAQFVLDNNGGPETLAQLVGTLHEVLLANATLHLRQLSATQLATLQENHA